MHTYRCEVCGQRATSHETTLDAGTIIERHRCEQHAELKLHVAQDESQQEAFRAMVEQFRRLPEREKAELALFHRLCRRFAS